MTEFEDFSKIDLNKKNINKLFNIASVILSEIIFNTKYFKPNINLKYLTSEILLLNYNDYLFDARPYLYGRIIRDLRDLKSKSPEDFINVSKNLQNYILKLSKNAEIVEKENKENKDNKKSTPNKKIIDDWRSIIES